MHYIIKVRVHHLKRIKGYLVLLFDLLKNSLALNFYIYINKFHTGLRNVVWKRLKYHEDPG